MFEEAPPLKVWAIPHRCFYFDRAFVFLVRVLLLWTLRNSVGAIEQKSGSRLDRNYPRYFSNIDCYSWVFLNRTCVVDPHEIEDSIFQVTHKKAKVLRVALNYMNMDLARRIDFFDYVSKNPPDYLFIENFGLNLEDNDSASVIPVPIDAALLHIRNQIRSNLVWVRTITTIQSGIRSTLNHYRK